MDGTTNRRGRHARPGRPDRHHDHPPPHHSHRGHSRSPHREDRSTYRDRDREGYRSPRVPSRSRSRSRGGSRSPERRSRSPYYGAPPGRELIMEGLPSDLNEDDIRHELEQYHEVRALDDVRIIRDRKTGVSRHFGFLRFDDAREATAFVKRNHGAIVLYGSGASADNDGGARVKVAFSRERDDRDRGHDADWKCPNCAVLNFSRRTECLRCHVPRSDTTTGGAGARDQPPRYTNTGDSDAATDSTPSQFLLVRSLEPGVSEEVLAKGITKLYKAHDDGSDHGPKKAAKVISTTSITNFGAQDGSLKRIFLIRDRRTDDSWRYGFAEFHSVDDAQAAVGKYNATDKFTISSKPVLISYIHAGVFVPVIDPSADADQHTFSATSNPALKLAYWDEGAYASELVISESPPEPDDGAPPPKGDRGESARKAGASKSGKDAASKKKRKAESALNEGNKKATPSHLQFWRNRHAELHGIEGRKGTIDDEKTSKDAVPADDPPTQGDKHAPPSQSFADLNKKCCYLCSRQFKSEAEVNKHERLSTLHRDNLQNDELKAKALTKLRANAPPPATDTLEYRDRAKERRSAFNQPKQPAAPKPGAVPKASASNEEDSQPVAPSKSKGASMLGRMGWSAGEGLGAQGTGIAAPITTDAYVQGVGLGAQGGKLGDAVDEASRNTKGGYDAFLERTKERAKERFERMG